MDKAQEIFGWVATCLTMCFYISPVFPFINVFKRKLSYEDTPIVIVSTSYLNCFCWYVYGDMIFSNQIKICNMVGACSSLILISIYLLYEIRKYTLDAILNILIISSGSYALYNGFIVLIDDDDVIGRICVGTSCIVFLSPIQLIYRVIKEKNYFLIPIQQAWVSLVASSCWTAYGVYLSNINVIIPNTVGIILAIVQIIVYYNFKSKYPAIGDKDFTSTIGIENTGFEEGKKDEGTTIKIDEDIKTSKEKPVKIVEK